MKNFIALHGLEIKDRLPGATVSYFGAENFTVAYTTLEADAEIPLHNHVNEAVDIILEGELEMRIGDETGILKPGMMSFVPSGIMHGAKAITNCKTVTILYPKR